MTETTSVPTEMTESVEEFAARARGWLADNMPRIDPDDPPEADRGEEAPWLRARELQKKVYEGGFAARLSDRSVVPLARALVSAITVGSARVFAAAVQ